MEEEKTQSAMKFTTADELTTFLMDLQGQMANMQETIDKLTPVEEQQPTDTDAVTTEEEVKEEVTEEELSEIDRLLQQK